MLNDAETQEAARIQARLQEKLAALDANTDLAPRGRDRLRARALLDAQNTLRTLREQSDAREKAAFDKAYKDAFGLSLERPGEDRQLRAELAANPPDAIEAGKRMVNALAIDDKYMARALAQIAFDHRMDELGGEAWIGVAELYGGSAPAVDKLMSAVFAAGAVPAKLDRFRDKVATEVQVPSDLQRGSLAAIASDDDGTAQAPGASFGA